jgi:hypothetical protein
MATTPPSSTTSNEQTEAQKTETLLKETWLDAVRQEMIEKKTTVVSFSVSGHDYKWIHRVLVPFLQGSNIGYKTAICFPENGGVVFDVSL